MLGQTGEAIAAFERALELIRDARTGFETRASWLAGLSEALLDAGENSRALQAAEESVTHARRHGSKFYLPMAYRALGEALLASEDPGRIPAAQQALDDAVAAVEETEVRAELLFIERARAKLIPVG